MDDHMFIIKLHYEVVWKPQISYERGKVEDPIVVLSADADSLPSPSVIKTKESQTVRHNETGIEGVGDGLIEASSQHVAIDADSEISGPQNEDTDSEDPDYVPTGVVSTDGTYTNEVSDDPSWQYEDLEGDDDDIFNPTVSVQDHGRGKRPTLGVEVYVDN
ncbi:unnamed protein product [Ilex paraguariensis]|uniref:Uncharacterized protein n=1 Tax=Ilex paraguariensis TaxID=185542 RepID=A0ABC8STZ6_9AQUA